MNKLKEDLTQKFQANDKQQSRQKLSSALIDYEKCLFSNKGYTWIFKDARWYRKQSRFLKEKKARVYRQAKSNWLPIACSSSPAFLVFQGQQL